MRIFLFLLCGGVVLSGCTSGVPSVARSTFSQDAVVTRDTIPHAPEAVWSVLGEVLDDMGFPQRSFDETREMITPFLNVDRPLYGQRNSVYFDCGAGTEIPLADQSAISFAMLTRVAPHRSGSVLLSQMEVRATRRDGVPGYTNCASTGALERMLAGRVAQRLRARGE